MVEEVVRGVGGGYQWDVVVACVDSCRTRCSVSSNICWSIGFLRKADAPLSRTFASRLGAV